MNFSGKIIRWYMVHKRDLPWRNTSDAYCIWLSEVIFQQTRIEQGLSYFNRFIQIYPTVEHLANANEMEVLKLWQGLGYYSRARNLLKTARIISRDYQGKFPMNEHELLALPGIGKYTAAAILSLAFNQAYPVVDGNVIRLISRVFGVELPVDKASGKRRIEELSHTFIDKSRPGDYNQAVMEFGALYCKPKNPGCEACIFKADCEALKQDKVKQWPMKAGKIVQQKRYLEYFIFSFDRPDGKFVFVNHRKEKDIWKRLYDFPHFDRKRKISSKQLSAYLASRYKLKNVDPVCLERNMKHTLSHQIIYASFYLIALKNEDKETHAELLSLGFEPRPLKTLHELPIPRLIDIFLEKNLTKI